MTIPSVTEFTGLLPDQNDPATFAGRAQALIDWLGAILPPEMNAVVQAINLALNDNGTVLDALAAFGQVGADLNEYTGDIDLVTLASGFYRVNTAATGTKPGALTDFNMIVMHRGSDEDLTQIAFGAGTSPFVREHSGGSWSAWRLIGDYPRVTVSGVPGDMTMTAADNGKEFYFSGDPSPLITITAAGVGPNWRARFVPRSGDGKIEFTGSFFANTTGNWTYYGDEGIEISSDGTKLRYHGGSLVLEGSVTLEDDSGNAASILGGKFLWARQPGGLSELAVRVSGVTSKTGMTGTDAARIVVPIDFWNASEFGVVDMFLPAFSTSGFGIAPGGAGRFADDLASNGKTPIFLENSNDASPSVLVSDIAIDVNGKVVLRGIFHHYHV